MKGKFTRKDNSKVLTTTRALVGGELVQVSGSRCISPIICNMLICLASINVRNAPLSLSLSASTQSYSYEGVDAKRIFKKQ